MLTAESSDRTVIHVELALSDSGMRFAAGDAVGVLPHNDPALVAGLLARLDVDGDDVFAVESATGESGSTSFQCSCTMMSCKPGSYQHSWQPQQGRAGVVKPSSLAAAGQCAGRWLSRVCVTCCCSCVAVDAQVKPAARPCSTTLRGLAPSGTPLPLAQVRTCTKYVCVGLHVPAQLRVSWSLLA